ncbi:MAG: hypothetical protein IKW21_01245 [Lachnospiraceae bacterium]|nr:hypothetical protein [Lachnospiraceae bacterium]
MTIDVKENMNGIAAPSFIEGQGVDADAAYQRLAVTRKTLAEYKAAINATNTVDVVGELKSLYADIEATMNLIILQEQMLINQGK